MTSTVANPPRSDRLDLRAFDCILRPLDLPPLGIGGGHGDSAEWPNDRGTWLFMGEQSTAAVEFTGRRDAHRFRIAWVQSQPYEPDICAQPSELTCN